MKKSYISGGICRVGLYLFGIPSLALGADIEFLTRELPWAIVDRAYSAPPLQVRASGMCPLGGVGFEVVSGALPPGIELSRLGYFSGTPLRTGAFEFAVRVSNGCTWTAKHFVLTVTGAPVLKVDPEKLVFRWQMGEALPPAQVVRVSATWPRFAYSATASEEWITALPEHGFTPRAASALTEDFVKVTIDPRNLVPGRHTAKLTISGWEALNSPAVQVIVEIPAKSGSPATMRPEGRALQPQPDQPHKASVSN